MDIKNINALIAALRAEVAKDSVSPDSLGAILQAIANALADVGSPADISALREFITTLFPANSLGEKYPRSAQNIMPQIIEMSALDDIPAQKTKSFLAGTKYQTEYLVTERGLLMGRLFLIADSMNHAVTQVLITHQLITPDGKFESGHGQALRLYFRRYNLTEHHGTPGEWSAWAEYVPIEEVQRLGKNVRDLGTFESEEAALLAAKLTNVSADATVTLIRFNWDGGKKNGFILQQVGSQVDDNLIDTYQFYTYGGRCWYRLIQWYYADDGKGHKSGDFYTATAWKSPFGNTLRFNENSRVLQLLSFKNDLVSQVTLPNDSLEDYVAGVEYDQGYLVVDAMARGQAGRQAYPLNIPTLQTAWNTGTEGSFIYSKPWVNGGDNSKTVLAVGSHIAQHGGKLKMRYIFWGGGSGAAYGNEVPVATATCDGAMSAADKQLLEDLKKRVEALEAKVK